MKRISLLALPLLLIATEAQAAVACQGTVTQVVLTPEGDVLADWGFGLIKLCISGQNTIVNKGPGNQGTINPTQCQTLYSGFASAQAAGRNVQAFVNRTDCSFTFTNGLPDPYPYAWYFLNY